MKIAHIAPLYESVPPKRYGGTERVVSYLVEEQVRQGHDVTVFASGDSKTSAKLILCSQKALWEGKRVDDELAPHLIMLHQAAEMAEEFDIIHAHVGYLAFPFLQPWSDKVIHTQHDRMDRYMRPELFRWHKEAQLVSISNAQRKPIPRANWVGTVYHGLPERLYRFTPTPQENYLAFLGRVSPEKGLVRAIEIAKKAGIPLKIAAKINTADEDYFANVITPLLEHPLIEYIGEVNDTQKSDFLGNARALLMPIDWPEPFGLVMIEAMACGTPVIGWPHGSVPEVVEPGVTGFHARTVEEAVRLLPKVEKLDRAAVRAEFEKRFSARRMSADYVKLYKTLVSDERSGENVEESVIPVSTQASAHGKVESCNL